MKKRYCEVCNAFVGILSNKAWEALEHMCDMCAEPEPFDEVQPREGQTMTTRRFFEALADTHVWVSWFTFCFLISLSNKNILQEIRTHTK